MKTFSHALIDMTLSQRLPQTRARIVFIIVDCFSYIFVHARTHTHQSFTANRFGSCLMFCSEPCDFHSRRYAVDRNNSQFNRDASNNYLFCLHIMSIYGDLFISVNFTFNAFLASFYARLHFLSTAYLLV